jgi:hypothetical protein
MAAGVFLFPNVSQFAGVMIMNRCGWFLSFALTIVFALGTSPM